MKFAFTLFFTLIGISGFARGSGSPYDGPLRGYTYLAPEKRFNVGMNYSLGIAKSYYNDDSEKIWYNEYYDFHADPIAASSRLSLWGEVGVINKLSVSMTLPLVLQRYYHVNAHSGYEYQDKDGRAGIGDLNVRVKYLFFNDRYLKYSSALRVYIPTGVPPHEIDASIEYSTGDGHANIQPSVQMDILSKNNRVMLSALGVLNFPMPYKYETNGSSHVEKSAVTLGTQVQLVYNLTPSLALGLDHLTSLCGEKEVDGTYISGTDYSHAYLSPSIGYKTTSSLIFSFRYSKKYSGYNTGAFHYYSCSISKVN